MFPAAEPVQKAMLPIMDRDGLFKPVIQVIAEEALDSGIEEVCIVCAPGEADRYRELFRANRDNLLTAYRGIDWAQEQAARIERLESRLRFAVQAEARGYGHAVLAAREFAADEPVLLLLGDHLYLADDPSIRCATQLLELARAHGCAVSAVNATREHLIRHYGTLTGERVAGETGVYRIERIREKPSLSVAEQELMTPGLRAGHYLCFFGMHVLTPPVFALLSESGASEGDELPLTPALDELARREKYLAVEIAGARYDIGGSLGFLRAQIALGVSGTRRDEVWSTIAETIADRRLHDVGAPSDPSTGES